MVRRHAGALTSSENKLPFLCVISLATFKQSSSLFHVQAVSITKVEVQVEPPKSQQSAAPTFNSSTPVTKLPASSAQIFSPNFTNISAIKKKEEKRDPRDVRRMLATPEGDELTRIFL